MKKIGIIIICVFMCFAFYGCSNKTDVDTHEHIAGEWTISKKPTCESNGKEVKLCTICSIEMESNDISNIDHISSEWIVVKKSTCETEGLRRKVCTVCEKELAEEIIPKHNIIYKKAISATCTETGLSAGSYCLDCGLVFEEQTIVPKISHNFITSNEVPASCDRPGLTKGIYCSFCGLIQLNQTTIPQKEHTSVNDSEVAATCTKTGLTEGSHCPGCNKVYVKQEVIPALGHNFDSNTGECTRCNDTDCVKYTDYDKFLSEYENQDSFIIDLRYMMFPSGQDYTIALKPNHKYVRVIGDINIVYTQVLFEIALRTQEINIDFVNVNLENKSTLIYTNASCDVNISLYGKSCSFVCLKGGNGYITDSLGLTAGEDGNIALDMSYANLNIFCSTESAKIKGGNGGDGGSSAAAVKPGGDGAYAIRAEKISVGFSEGYTTENIVIEEGKGGSGGYRWFFGDIYGEEGFTPAPTNTPIIYL